MASRVLQQLLDAHYPTFAATHPLPDYVRDAVHALRSCRTAALGGHVQACPDGHVERVWYNSCRHRFCPQCAQLQIAQWLERQRARLLAWDHYHVIFTLPRDLNPLWLAKVRTNRGSGLESSVFSITSDVESVHHWTTADAALHRTSSKIHGSKGDRVKVCNHAFSSSSACCTLGLCSSNPAPLALPHGYERYPNVVHSDLMPQSYLSFDLARVSC